MKIGVATAIYVSNVKLFEYAKATLDSIQSEEHEIVTCGWLNRPISDCLLEPFQERQPRLEPGHRPSPERGL